MESPCNTQIDFIRHMHDTPLSKPRDSPVTGKHYRRGRLGRKADGHPYKRLQNVLAWLLCGSNLFHGLYSLQKHKRPPQNHGKFKLISKKHKDTCFAKSCEFHKKFNFQVNWFLGSAKVLNVNPSNPRPDGGTMRPILICSNKSIFSSRRPITRECQAWRSTGVIVVSNLRRSPSSRRFIPRS